MFADLQQQVATTPSAGSVYKVKRVGVEYLQAKISVAGRRYDVALGRADGPDVATRATLLRRGMVQSRQRRALVAMLKRGGLADPGAVVGATLDAIAYAGLFRGGAVLVGTVAYLMMEPHIGTRLTAPTLMTGDLDLATATLALSADPPTDMKSILGRADPTFEGVLQLDPRRPASRFRNATGFLVDLVTPVRHRDDENPVPLPALNAGAAPLQHLGWLIADPLETVALWGAGVAVRIPQPARFAVHKLILAQRRAGGNAVKRTKDLAQAKALIDALERHSPFALEDALADAREQGRVGWSDLIDRSLAEIARLSAGG